MSGENLCNTLIMSRIFQIIYIYHNLNAKAW